MKEVKDIWQFFENMNEYVYATDIETHEIVYMNRKTLHSCLFLNVMDPLIVSEEFFDLLTDEQQQIIKEAADTAKEYAREQSDARIASRMDTIRESGTEIITPSEELYNEIRELCKPIYASIENSVSQEIIDAYLGDMQEELQ